MLRWRKAYAEEEGRHELESAAAVDVAIGGPWRGRRSAPVKRRGIGRCG
jgi:hypothetical protein